jgi:hypothetical protein
MDDPILKLRLQMMGDNLQVAVRMVDFLAQDLRALEIDTTALSDAFDYHTQQQLRKLKRASENLDNIDGADVNAVRSAWSSYSELREANSQIYREFLEAMLGLAMRRNKIDEQTCRIADALIVSMKSFLAKADALAIPASHEAYSKTLARLIRMRFPEWTIWSLPLVAHEFGHVVIEDVSELLTFANDLATAAALQRQEFITNPANDAERRKNQAITRREVCRIRQLMADAFAVYRIGPAYPCTLVLLRLSPVESDSDEGCPRDAERAAVAIEVLRQMADASPKPTQFVDIVKYLEDEWSGMMKRSGVTPLDQNHCNALLQLAGRIKQELDDVLVGAGYSLRLPGGGGWNTAYGWYVEWAQQGKMDPNRLKAPENLNATSKIYDALNAAWAYRLFEKPTSLEPVARATRETCEAMIARRLEETKTGTGGIKTPVA